MEIIDRGDNYEKKEYSEGYLLGISLHNVGFAPSVAGIPQPNIPKILSKIDKNSKLIFSPLYIDSCTFFSYIGYPVSEILPNGAKRINFKELFRIIKNYDKKDLVKDLRLVGIGEWFENKSHEKNSLEKSISLYRIQKAKPILLKEGVEYSFL